MMDYVVNAHNNTVHNTTEVKLNDAAKLEDPEDGHLIATLSGVIEEKAHHSPHSFSSSSVRGANALSGNRKGLEVA